MNSIKYLLFSLRNEDEFDGFIKSSIFFSIFYKDSEKRIKTELLIVVYFFYCAERLKDNYLECASVSIVSPIFCLTEVCLIA